MLEEQLVAGTVLRCKMRVHQVTREIRVGGEDEEERVKLWTVTATGGENDQWSGGVWANFEITINNPAAFGKLAIGHEVYVDFTPAG